MAQQYEIRLPEGMKLMVTITGDPIDFDLVFPNHRKVNFKDTPGEGASITLVDGLHTAMADEPLVAGERPGKRTTVSQSLAGGPTISYVIYADGTGPMVPRRALPAAM